MCVISSLCFDEQGSCVARCVIVYLIVVFVGLFLCLVLAIMLAFWCCRSAYPYLARQIFSETSLRRRFIREPSLLPMLLVRVLRWPQ